MKDPSNIRLLPSPPGTGKPDPRIALALSILQHRPWAAEDRRHVDEAIAARNGRSIEHNASGEPACLPDVVPVSTTPGPPTTAGARDLHCQAGI